MSRASCSRANRSSACRGTSTNGCPSPSESISPARASATEFYAQLPELWASVHLVGGFAMAPLCDTSVADFERYARAQRHDLFFVLPGGGAENARTRRRPPGQRHRSPGPRAGRRAWRPTPPPRQAVGIIDPYPGGRALGRRHSGQTPSFHRSSIHRPIVGPCPTRISPTGPSPTSWPTASVFWASPQNRVTSGCLVPVYGAA